MAAIPTTSYDEISALQWADFAAAKREGGDQTR